MEVLRHSPLILLVEEERQGKALGSEEDRSEADLVLSGGMKL
jgi:hypothetical protein